MRTSTEFTARDRSRRPDAKRADLSRRGQRRAKSAMQFLAFAFPADLSIFASGS